MHTYIIRRVLTAIPLLIFISIICFSLMQLAPGGPLARLEGNPNIRPEDIEIKKKLLGLDKPKPVQYLIWFWRVLHLDFGESYVTREPVLGMVFERVPATMQLMVSAMLLALGFGLAMGIVSALRRASWAARAVATAAVAPWLSAWCFPG